MLLACSYIKGCKNTWAKQWRVDVKMAFINVPIKEKVYYEFWGKATPSAGISQVSQFPLTNTFSMDHFPAMFPFINVALECGSNVWGLSQGVLLTPLVRLFSELSDDIEKDRTIKPFLKGQWGQSWWIGSAKGRSFAFQVTIYPPVSTIAAALPERSLISCIASEIQHRRIAFLQYCFLAIWNYFKYF